MVAAIFNTPRLIILTSFTLLTLLNQRADAFTIYLEDFNESAEQGQGAIGVNNSTPRSIDTSGVDWTVSNISNAVDLTQTQQNNDGLANLTATTDWFQVRNNRFEAQDVDGPAIWSSPVIDISSFSDVSFSLDFSEVGDFEETGGNGALDFVDVEYIVDGASVTLPNQNGFAGDPNFEQHTLLGDFTNQAISQTGLSGNNLQLVVTIQNWAGNELTTFDNVLVEEVPWEISPNLGLFLVGSLFGFHQLKRKLKSAK